MRKTLRADLHIHSCYSVDSLSKLEEILEAAVKKGLSAIAVCDHNEIAGAIEAQRIVKEKKLPLQVIVGEEVETEFGHVLVYFLKRKIENGKLKDVLAKAKKQGAICCLAHPYDSGRKGQGASIPEKLLLKMDGIEAFNARVLSGSSNENALVLAEKYRKPVFAGSDAHHASEIGSAYVEFKGIGKLDKKTLLYAKRKICGKRSPAYVRLFSRYAALRKRIEKLISSL